MRKEGERAHIDAEQSLRASAEKREKYATIQGFLGDILTLRLIENRRTGEDDLFVKFTLGRQEWSGDVSWLVVAMRGTSAEHLCELVAKTAKEPGRHYLALRGAYQERHDPKSHRVRQEFWAFAVKPLVSSAEENSTVGFHSQEA